MDLPSPETLSCFLAAAELRNFRAAASRVALSPAAFGERIRRLEEQVGAPLFERTTRSVALTERGAELVPRARQAVEASLRCLEGGSRLPFALTLGTRFELGMSWLVPGLAALEAARPERTLHLHFGDTPDLMANLREDRIDAAVTSARLVESGFAHATLHPETYVFVAAATLAAERPLTGPADADLHRLIDISPDLPLFRYLLDAGADSPDWPFAGRSFLGTIGAVRARVREGAGVAVLPEYFVAEDLAARVLVRVAAGLRLREDAFRLVWRQGHPRERELRSLAAELRGRPLA